MALSTGCKEERGEAALSPTQALLCPEPASGLPTTSFLFHRCRLHAAMPLLSPEVGPSSLSERPHPQPQLAALPRFSERVRRTRGLRLTWFRIPAPLTSP